MRILPLHSLGRIADVQMCPRRRYWHWEHLGSGIEPYRLPWKLALESVLCTAIHSALVPTGEEIQSPAYKLPPQAGNTIEVSEAIKALAVSPGISGLVTENTPEEVGELARLAGALALAWQRRRAPIMARSEHQPATLIVGVSQHQPATDRPDSRLFDVLLHEDSVMLEWFVLGQRWDGWRFNNPLLYYWKTVKDNTVTWQKPEAKAMCYEPVSMENWIETLEKFQDDAIGKVLLGGRITWPEDISATNLDDREFNRKRIVETIEHSRTDEPEHHYRYNLAWLAEQYVHSCRGCDCVPICWGPEPFPVDATEAYPAIFKKRK